MKTLALILFIVGWPAAAVDLDQPFGDGDPRPLRQVVTSGSPERIGPPGQVRARLARFGLTLRMTADEVARFEMNPRDPVFTPLRAINLRPFVVMNDEKVFSILEDGGVFLVLDFEKMMAREVLKQQELRYARFAGLGFKTMDNIARAINHRGWTTEARFDLTRLDLPDLTPAWFESRGLYGVVSEQELLRAGLTLREVLRIAEALRTCGQLLAAPPSETLARPAKPG